VPAKRRDSYLGRDRIRRLVRLRGHPFEERAGLEFFGSEGAQERFLAAWRDSVGRTSAVATDPEFQPLPPEPFVLAGGATSPDHHEQFLVVDVVWGDGTRVTYGEIDRPLVDRPLLGAVLEIGDINRQLSPDNDLQRNGFEITFADLDGEFATRIADGSYLGALVTVKIGTTQWPEAFWRKWGVWSIDRETGHSPTTASFALEDAAEAVLGDEIRLPAIGDLDAAAGEFGPRLREKLHLSHDFIHRNFQHMVLGDTDSTEKAIDENNADRRIPLVLGDEIYKPALCWVNYDLVKQFKSNYSPAAGAPGDALNPLAVIVLGASKLPNWEVERRPYSRDGHLPTNPLTDFRDWEVWAQLSERATESTDVGGQIAKFSPVIGSSRPDFLVKMSNTTGIVPYIEVYKLRDWDGTGSAHATDRAYDYWYVPVLYLCYSASALGDTDKAFRVQLGVALSGLYDAAQREAVYIRTPGWGGEGKGAAGDRDHNAGAAIRYLMEHHSSISRANLRGAFGATLDSLQKADGMSRVGGTIAEDQPISEVITGICRSWHCDVFLDRTGRPGYAARDLTPEDRSYLLRYCATYTDEYDIARGTFVQRQLVGNDRFGQASVFKFRGLKDHTLARSPWLDESYPYDMGGSAVAELGGRRIEKNLDVSWRPQPLGGQFLAQQGPEIAREWLTPRTAAKLALPLNAVEDLAAG
jgi:hypothetical protein